MNHKDQVTIKVEYLFSSTQAADSKNLSLIAPNQTIFLNGNHCRLYWKLKTKTWWCTKKTALLKNETEKKKEKALSSIMECHPVSLLLLSVQ